MFGHDAAHRRRTGVAATRKGLLEWAAVTGGAIESSPASPALATDGTTYAIAEDGTIYCGSFDGHLYALTPSGSVKWTFATGDWARSSPAIGADGTVYVGSWDGKLYALGG